MSIRYIINALAAPLSTKNNERIFQSFWWDQIAKRIYAESMK